MEEARLFTIPICIVCEERIANPNYVRSVIKKQHLDPLECMCFSCKQDVFIATKGELSSMMEFI